MGDERGDILATFSQRREQDREHVEPVVEVDAVLGPPYHVLEVPIGGCDQSYIDTMGLRAAEALKFLLLEHAQQFRLQRERNIADFVEEQRAAVRHLESADLLRDRTRECTFLMAEQLAFEQIERNRGAVHFHERTSAARAERVDRARDELFARTSLSVNQYGRLGGRDAFDLFEHGLEGWTGSNDLIEARLVGWSVATGIVVEPLHVAPPSAVTCGGVISAPMLLSPSHRLR